MNLHDYFSNTKGRGIMATADAEGKVDAAVYARPHVMEDGSLGFIMRDRLTHANLQSNPHAAYLFIEDGPGFKGTRLFLTQLGEEKNTERLFALRRRDYGDSQHGTGAHEDLFLVLFRVDKTLPLIGPGAEV
jgi:hypothetical protein